MRLRGGGGVVVGGGSELIVQWEEEVGIGIEFLSSPGSHLYPTTAQLPLLAAAASLSTVNSFSRFCKTC